MTITSDRTLDIGQEIAREYWLQTDHVFARGYPDTTHCALCGINGSSGHIEATPETKPTVIGIRDGASSPANRWAEITLSCGHGPLHSGGYHKDLPKVGATYSCTSCTMDWHEQNHPGLPESIRQQIEALIPKCPQCMQPVEKIPFVTRTVHTVFFDMDGQTGELDGESDHDDTLDEQPDWIGFPDVVGGWYTGEIAVECKNLHGWRTKQLAYRHHDGDHDWRIVKPA